jgi:hypothetical protein
MKNSLLAFAFALLVVLSSSSIRQSVTGIGGTPIPIPPAKVQAASTLSIGGTPIPIPPAKETGAPGIGGTPIPIPPAK